MSEWKKKPLLDLTFCLSLVREILFLSFIFPRDVCGIVSHFWLIPGCAVN